MGGVAAEPEMLDRGAIDEAEGNEGGDALPDAADDEIALFALKTGNFTQSIRFS